MFETNIFKKILIVIMVVSVGIVYTVSSFAENNNETPSSWAVEKIDLSRQLSLINEDLDKDYQKEITREEFALLAMQLLEKFAPSDESINNSRTSNDKFSDIVDAKYKEDIKKAYVTGIISGFEDNTFRPKEFIKRQEMCAMLVKLYKSIFKTAKAESWNTYNFGDLNKISSWARKVVFFCYENELIHGTGNNEVTPLGYSTREQSILLMHNLYSLASAKGIIAIDKSIEKDNLAKAESLFENIRKITENSKALTNKTINKKEARFVFSENGKSSELKVRLTPYGATKAELFQISYTTQSKDTNESFGFFKELLKNYNQKDEIIDTISRKLEQFEINKKMDLFTQKINGAGSIKGYSSGNLYVIEVIDESGDFRNF